jgi:hypothetical protein
MVMGSRGETTVCPEAPAKAIERVEVAVAVMVTAVAAAEVIAVIRTSSPFTPAAAKAPKKMGDVPMEPGIKRKSSSAPPSQMGEGSEPGKMPFIKT